MAIATGTAIALAASAAASTGGAIYSAKKQAKSAKEAGTIQQQAADAALAFEREKYARELKQYEEERSRSWRLEDEDRTISHEDRARRIRNTRPYAELGGSSAASILDLMRPHPEIDLHVQPRPAQIVPAAATAAPMAAVPNMSMLDLTRMSATQPYPMDEVPRPNA